jgi:murein DD-endopeptidase MepM/ murein hydrolase activator NlpD
MGVMSRFIVSMFSVTFLLLSGPQTVDGGRCVGLEWPLSGQIANGFQPTGRYSGHWGIDIGAEEGTPVSAAAAGRVTFAGLVVDNQTVTIDHGGGLKTSYSFLKERSVAAGAWVEPGRTIGRSGSSHEIAGLHFSVRLSGTYVDPLDWVGCQGYQPARALRLVG